MQPDFNILADRQDITERLRVSLRVTDEAGTQSDTVEIQLDDRDGRIEWPSHGSELEVWLGYQQTSLSRMGLYIIGEVEHSGPPSELLPSQSPGILIDMWDLGNQHNSIMPGFVFVFW